MTIAIFGGSFNPPHVAHQLVALYVLETHPDVHELWFVPTYTHVFGKELVAYDHRVAMCELAARPLGSRVVVDRSEEALAKRPGFAGSRTLDLIEMLEAAHPHDQFRLVIGSDILGETHKWHRWDEIERRAPPIVVSRPGYPGGTGVPIDVSATRVRQLLAAGGAGAEAMVPATVLRYIAANQLYL
jgi:nicotinate-nucleotide adenylyltransferase